mgnify:CR=1 FL=1
MISNQILQNTIDGLKEITRIDLCVMDTDGKTLATTFRPPKNHTSRGQSARYHVWVFSP